MLNSRSLSLPTIFLHWIIAIAFIGVFALGLYMVDLPRSPDKFQLYDIHKSIGFLILLVAIIRIIWRVKEGAIPPASPMPAWQEKLGKAVHGMLMLATLAMPLSGILMSMGGGRAIEVFGVQVIAAGEKMPMLQETASTIHGMAVYVLVALFVLHGVGALKHQLIDKDGTITRMLGRA
ncbi:cytochrome B561 [Vibrio astriarenae]|uniref:Cytochrome b n=1 Tax=Vibrio astriarenae TaxID=1481923 RepID=A0A7Z2YFM8_9VIBR|nr:cytochrome b [Vibrio astriarenae]QIA65643.1 cytochrome b [Vibrio astriarenae]GAL15525.1 cytochrome B561 [Vibrio sp. C7]